MGLIAFCIVGLGYVAVFIWAASSGLLGAILGAR